MTVDELVEEFGVTREQVRAVLEFAAQTLTLPEDLRAEVEKVARAQERPVNEVLADAVDRYVKDEQWQSLKAYGRERAEACGIRKGDVLRLIAESRREHDRGR